MPTNYVAILNKELTHVIQKDFETIYDSTKFRQYLPIAPAEGTGLKTLEWNSYTAVGMAKIISDYSDDFPTVDLYASVQSSSVRHVGSSYGYTFFEMEKADRAGVPLDRKRSVIVKRAIEAKVDQVAWFGEADYNIKGFINAEGISEYIITNGASGAKTWASKTPSEILKDMTLFLQSIPANTHEKETPNTVLLPYSRMQTLQNTYLDTTTYNKTLLQAIQENFRNITTWGWLTNLDTAGAGGTARMIAYDKDPSKLEFHMPVPLRVLPLNVVNGMKYTIPYSADVGGTTIYYPQSVCHADGL